MILVLIPRVKGSKIRSNLKVYQALTDAHIFQCIQADPRETKAFPVYFSLILGFQSNSHSAG